MCYENSVNTSLLNFKCLILKRQDRVHFVRIWGQTSGENFEGTALGFKNQDMYCIPKDVLTVYSSLHTFGVKSRTNCITNPKT